MLISRKPVFWAFYSPGFAAHPLHGKKDMPATQKSIQPNKINAPLIVRSAIQFPVRPELSANQKVTNVAALGASPGILIRPQPVYESALLRVFLCNASATY